MNEESARDFIFTAMTSAAYLGGPLLVGATIAGLAVAIMFAAMQIQEQVFPTAMKIILITAGVYFAGERLSAPLVGFTETVLTFGARQR